jgi:aspartyl/asparaginyl-tRNA synthetase
VYSVSTNSKAFSQPKSTAVQANGNTGTISYSYEHWPSVSGRKSFTSRYLTEFTGLDMTEIVEDHYELIYMLEQLMLFIFRGLPERFSKETEMIGNVYPVQSFKLPAIIPRFSSNEGIRLLREDGEPVGDYGDLSTPQDKRLGQLVLEKVNMSNSLLLSFQAFAKASAVWLRLLHARPVP